MTERARGGWSALLWVSLTLALVAVAALALGSQPWFAVLGGAAGVALLTYLYIQTTAADRELRHAVARLSEATGLPRNVGAPEAIVAASERLIESAAAARRGAARLASTLDRMGDPVLVLDASGRAEFANPALDALAGVGAAGRPVDELFPASELPRVHAAALAGETVTETIVLRRASGARVWEVSARPLPEWEGDSPERRPSRRAEKVGGTGHVLLTFREVTEAARALQVRTDFVANASHELRTPIAAIRMALDTLGTVGEEDAPLRERLMAMIAGQVARLEELARDLLDLSRLESEAEVRLEPVDLVALAPLLRARFEAVCAERRLSLEFEVGEGASPLRTDRRLLEQILGNLIENATKFAFEGTAIRVVAMRAEGVARLEVIDRGVGIPLDQQQRIFERFYQADPSRSGARRGSGLGLAIVKHAVRRLGGTIRVSSVWQQGTTMTVELPALS